MFCTTLRRRSSFASIVPTLTSTTGLSLRESDLTTHDIAIQIPSSAQKRTLRILLLSPSTTSTSNLPNTISRIQHFASLTGGTDIAIIFSLTAPTAFKPARSLLVQTQDGLAGYTRLQSELLDRSEIPCIPILLLTSPEALVEVVKGHVQAVSRQRSDVTTGVRAEGLLASCTTDIGLTSFAVSVTTDVFPDLASLASAGVGYRAPEGDESGRWDGVVSSEGAKTGFDVLEEQLGKEVVGGMLEFWADDWVID